MKISHTFIREGKMIKGKITNVVFEKGEKRGEYRDYHSKDRNFYIASRTCPQIEKNNLYVWGNQTSKDNETTSYGFNTVKEAKQWLKHLEEFEQETMTLKEFLKEVDCSESDITNYSGDEALEKVKYDGFNLKYVKDQTEEICLEAVKEEGDALLYVKDQTVKICLEAIKESCDSLKYVKDQTEEICLEAVKQNGYALKYVKDQTIKICLEAVKDDSCSIEYVDKNIFSNKERSLKDRVNVLEKRVCELENE